MGTAKCNTTRAADGRSLIPPRIQIPRRPSAPPTALPLTAKITEVIAPMLVNGSASFSQVVDAMIDHVVHHIRTASMAKLDQRIADAIEDHLTVDPMEGDHDQAAECSDEDLDAIREENARAWNGGAL